MSGKPRAANDQGRGMDPRAGRAPVIAALDIGQSKGLVFHHEA